MRALNFSATLLAALLLLPATTAPSHAGGVFSALAGSWSGGGSLKLANGKREKLTCRAYYTKNGGSGLGIAIRCASPSSKIHMRGSLQQGGSSVTGTWEERTFNAGGSVSGTASDSSLRLSIRGSVAGSLSISINGNRATVNLSTNKAGGVSLSFRRS
ncbi:MAG: hypothetical protein KJ587_07325 [Alphaproteobacteria bacterium]|nr:hypothetical protein [Alphaproteobacteria bacterium]